MTLWEEQEAQISTAERRILRLRAALKQYADHRNWGPRTPRDWPPQLHDWWQPEGHGYELAERVLATDGE